MVLITQISHLQGLTIFSDNSLEAKIHSLALWMMKMILCLASQECKSPSHLINKDNNNKIHLVASVVSEVALEALVEDLATLETLVASMTKITMILSKDLEEAALLLSRQAHSQEDQVHKVLKHKLIWKMAKG